MTTATQNIISLLANPSTEGINALFCDASIHKALSVATPAEWRFAKDMKAQQWIDDRNAEYEARRLALLAHVEGEKVSRETADKIDRWAEANPYIRPVNNDLVAQIEADLEAAEAKVSEAYAKRNQLHEQDRFGWDSKANAEDLEYREMLQELANAETTRNGLQGKLSLAVGGFLR